MPRDPSRWWYALLPYPVLVGLRYALVWLTAVLLPTAGPSRAEAMPVLLAGLAASIVGALVTVTAPLFGAGLLLDVRALRTRSSWSPHWGYGAVGLLPVLGVFLEWLALVSVPVAVGYLALRRRRIGYPLGRGRPQNSSTGGVTSSAGASRWAYGDTSRWFYGVVLPPVLELTGDGLRWGVTTTGVLQGGSDPLTLLVPVAVTLVAVGSVPLFAASLYLDATAVSGHASETTLDPRVWGLLGLGSLVGLALVQVTFMPVVALAYVVWRRSVGGS